MDLAAKTSRRTRRTKGMAVPSRKGEQLVLLLEDRRLVVPWNGRSPRSLTRAHERFSFVRSGTGRANPDLSLGVQLTLFPEERSDGTS